MKPLIPGFILWNGEEKRMLVLRDVTTMAASIVIALRV
jgi:hypothetical protein